VRHEARGTLRADPEEEEEEEEEEESLEDGSRIGLCGSCFMSLISLNIIHTFHEPSTKV